jgi:lipoprotein-anchoring transpeptidase ErfK/SrfK
MNTIKNNKPKSVSSLLYRIGLILVFAAPVLQPTQTVQASDTVQTVEPYQGVNVCAPNSVSDDCLAVGPAQTLSQWSAKGLSYPLVGLPAYTPDASLNQMPYRYASIIADSTKPIRLFPSLNDAVASENQSGSIPAGVMRWVAYSSQADVNNNHYVMLPDSSEWVRASPADVNYFQGLAFYRTPDHDFGWFIDQANSHTSPSLESPVTGNHYYRNTVVQIFDTKQGNQEDWYQIGINEWVERKSIRKVTINTKPPTGVTGDRWIEVNLYEQTLSVYDKGQLIFGTLIASGMDPFFTRPGTFQIQTKKETEKMTGASEADLSDYYYLDKVPWTMYFDGARALHAAYWRAMYGYPQSHGCVNIAPGDAHFIYNWANVGDWVYVWDPSGKTPTDPAKYGQGGA